MVHLSLCGIIIGIACVIYLVICFIDPSKNVFKKHKTCLWNPYNDKNEAGDICEIIREFFDASGETYYIIDNGGEYLHTVKKSQVTLLDEVK